MKVKEEIKYKILGILNEMLKKFTWRWSGCEISLRIHTQRPVLLPLYFFCSFISPYGTKDIFVFFFFNCVFFTLKRYCMEGKKYSKKTKRKYGSTFCGFLSIIDTHTIRTHKVVSRVFKIEGLETFAFKMPKNFRFQLKHAWAKGSKSISCEKC